MPRRRASSSFTCSRGPSPKKLVYVYPMGCCDVARRLNLANGGTMSYSFNLFHPIVQKHVEQGKEIDEFDHPPLDSSAVERFISNLAKYGYIPESTTPQCREFVKSIDGCPIQVSVFTTE